LLLDTRCAGDLGQSRSAAQRHQGLRQRPPHPLSRDHDGVRLGRVDDARSSVLMTADELAGLLDAKQSVVLLDVLDEAGAAPDERPKIPGALSVNLAADFSGKPTALSGRRPLPDIAELQAKARAWGIGRAGTVVVYDNAGGAQASRAWWTLRWAGV